jgi:hypothetical protein
MWPECIISGNGARLRRNTFVTKLLGRAVPEMRDVAWALKTTKGIKGLNLQKRVP